MKTFFVLFLLAFPTLHVYSQSLTVDETIEYLNKLSKEHPHSFRPYSSECDYIVYYQFSIDKEGILTIYGISSKSNCNGNEESYKDLKNIHGKFYIQDLNTEKIKEDNPYSLENAVKLICRFNDDCITQTFFPKNKEVFEKTSWINLFTSDRYNKNKLYNAFVYLITTAIEKGYVRNDVGDPFAILEEKEIPKIETKKTPTSSPNIKSKPLVIPETRIYLKREGGVFSLNVTTNGIVSKFILDSGAGECNISPDTERKLIAAGIITRKDYLNNGLYRIADGTVVENRRVRIPKMTIGNKIVYNVIASVGPLGSPNLLGQSFLKRLNIWSIDNSKGVLIIK